MGGGGKNAAKKSAEEARAAEEARQASIRAGQSKIDETFGQFDDQFYAGRSDAFRSYAMPQVEQQRDKASREALFDLARRGLTDSSAASSLGGELQRMFTQQKQQVEDEALSYATKARGAVEGARSDLVSMLHATGDGQAAAQGAVNRAAQLNSPDEFSVLAPLFSDFTNALATQAGYERAAAIDPRYKPRYNTGLFSTPSNAVTVK